MILQSNPKANYLAHRTEIDAAVARVLESGWYILGQEVAQFETAFAAAMNAPWSVGVANGTDAIELALRVLGVGPGDGVLTVSHTAVATVAAIARIGAHPVFVDIDPLRFTMSPASLEDALDTPAGQVAKALVVVHLYGMPADMPAILELAKQHDLPVVEDCAQAHGATLQGRTVGTWGDLGCFSFYPTKNLGALGDGGAVIGRDSALEERVRLLREYGWRTRYVSESFGLNSRLDEIQAAILRAKLPHLANENHRRRALAGEYDELLKGSGVEIPVRHPDTEHVFHQYVIRAAQRDALRDALREHGIATLIHYPLAVHQQPAYHIPELSPVPLKHTEASVAHILSLPMYPEMTETQVAQVSSALHQLTSA